MSLKDMVFPISISYPVSIVLNPNTGELHLTSSHLVGNETISFQVRIEAKALQELLSVIPDLQKNYGELIAEKAKGHSLQ